MRLAVYIRVSSAEQIEGYSLDAQEGACRAWAASNGYDVAHLFVEPGQSARTDQRPAFQQMITAVCATPRIDGVLIHKSDRIARNLLDLLTYRNLLERHGKRILSVTEPFFNDDSPENRMVCGIVGSVNEFYSANLSREVKKGQVQKAKSGSFPGGRVPMGYTRKDKIIILDETAPAIRSGFYEFANGKYTLREWAAKAIEVGFTHKGAALSAQSWQKIFRNPFYTGQFTWQDELFTGDHPALVDPETFNRVQELLTAADSGGSKNRHFWLLSGLLWSLKYNTKMSGSLSGGYTYYRASGKGPEHAVRAEELEKRVITQLERIRGELAGGREDWRLAVSVAPSIRVVFEKLKTPYERRELLLLVIRRHGVFVSAGGAVVKLALHAGFEYC